MTLLPTAVVGAGAGGPAAAAEPHASDSFDPTEPFDQDDVGVFRGVPALRTRAVTLDGAAVTTTMWVTYSGRESTWSGPTGGRSRLFLGVPPGESIGPPGFGGGALAIASDVGLDPDCGEESLLSVSWDLALDGGLTWFNPHTGADEVCRTYSYLSAVQSPGLYGRIARPTGARVDDGSPVVLHDWVLSDPPAWEGICGAGTVGWRAPVFPDRDHLFWDDRWGGWRFHRGIAARYLTYDEASTNPNGWAIRSTFTAVYAPPSPDITAPYVSLTSPGECEVYDPGQDVTAEFTCEDIQVDGPPVQAVTCVGTAEDGRTVLPGDPIDTWPGGKHILRITGTDAAGNSRTRDAIYYVDDVPVTVVAPSVTRPFGTGNPSFEPTYEGVPSGVDPITEATCVTSADSSSLPGTYPITCSGAERPGFSFSYQDGTLDITPAPVTVAGPSLSRTYGTENPLLPPSYAGLPPNTEPATAPTCATSADTTSLPGTYPIMCSGAEDPRLTFTYQDGTLEITPAPVHIRADPVRILRSLLRSSVRFSATVTHHITGAPLVDVPVTFTSSRTLFGPIGWCTAMSDANGVATCHAGVLQFLLRAPGSYAASTSESATHLRGMARGDVRL